MPFWRNTTGKQLHLVPVPHAFRAVLALTRRQHALHHFCAVPFPSPQIGTERRTVRYVAPILVPLELTRIAGAVRVEAELQLRRVDVRTHVLADGVLHVAELAPANTRHLGALGHLLRLRRVEGGRLVVLALAVGSASGKGKL